MGDAVPCLQARKGLAQAGKDFLAFHGMSS